MRVVEAELEPVRWLSLFPWRRRGPAASQSGGPVTLARRIGGLLAGALAAAFIVWDVAGGWYWQLDPSLLVLAVVAFALF